MNGRTVNVHPSIHLLPPLNLMESSNNHAKKKKKNKVEQDGGVVEQKEKEKEREKEREREREREIKKRQAKPFIETAPVLPLFKSVILPEIHLDIYNIAGGLAWGKREISFFLLFLVLVLVVLKLFYLFFFF